MQINFKITETSVELNIQVLMKIMNFMLPISISLLVISLSLIAYFIYSSSGLHLAYNDAMSHINISRRVYDSIQPGLTQLGSVWLPLPHILMLPLVWNNTLWHSGFAGGYISMISYVICCISIYKSVYYISKNKFAAIVTLLFTSLNLNFLYLQTTALTEPLFMALFSLSFYFLLRWKRYSSNYFVILSGFCMGLMTMTRYDAWFLLPVFASAIFIINFVKKGIQKADGQTILFLTIASFGIVIWFFYNYLIFGEPFYFAIGEFSAKSQQNILLNEGVLQTKGNILFSLLTYVYSVIDNIGVIAFILSILGFLTIIYKNKSVSAVLFSLILISVFLFNVISLFLGFSVLYVPELIGNSWFNVRYGLLFLPSAAILIGYLFTVKERIVYIVVPILLGIQTLLFFVNNYAVTITDGTVGSSQKNVKSIGNKLNTAYKEDEGLILISVASHDAIIFTSKIDMDKFIHEGVNRYWDEALVNPQKKVKYIVMKTGDKSDRVALEMSKINNFNKLYDLVYDGNFADIYKLKND